MVYHILSLGAGVNSTALLHVLLDDKMPLDEVVFADGGAERPETYAYIRDFIEPFLGSRSILFTVVRPKTQLIDRCLKGHAIPDKVYRWCTRDMKIRPIEKHLKPKSPVVQYLGIAYDEIHRMKGGPHDWLRTEWPLIDRKITREGCVRIIQEKGWLVPVKSGCYFCPFQGKRGFGILHTDHPDLYDIAIKVEENGSGFPHFCLVDGGLRNLARRFNGGDDSRQVELTSFTEECSGYCFT
jgi:hypothetical protein